MVSLSSLRFSALLSLVFAAAACSSADTDLDPRPPCTGEGCVNPSGGGTNTGGSGSGGAGGQGGQGGELSSDVTGNVGVLNDPSFTLIGPYAGAATIFATSSSGQLLEAPYGDMITSFTLPSVMSGTPWLFVRDETVGGTGILSTHSAVQVPRLGSVTLPVVDRNVLQSIASTLPAPLIIDASRAQLIIKITRGGLPLSGVTLTTPLPGAEITYDTGVGLYSNQTKQTDQAGVILALNVIAPDVAEIRTFTLTDAAQIGFVVELPIQAGAATVAGFAL